MQEHHKEKQMTAPLLQKTTIENTYTPQALTLHAATYQLLDAIDDNNIEQVELSMSKILKNKVPEVSIRVFLNYAEVNQKTKVCEYLGLLFLTTYNTPN